VSQPQPYSPQHAFVADSATVPNFPGQALDVEHNAIKTTTDQIRANLALIQRDDGAPANSIVTYDTLAPALQTNGLATASAWLTTTNYLVGTTVYQNSNLYRCLIAHTAGVFATDLAAGKWLLLVALPTGPQGPIGTPNTLAIGTVTAGAAAASITGSAPNQTLHLTLQTGNPGPTGPGYGGTSSTSYPTVNPYQPALGGQFDAFIARVEPSANGQCGGCLGRPLRGHRDPTAAGPRLAPIFEARFTWSCRCAFAAPSDEPW